MHGKLEKRISFAEKQLDMVEQLLEAGDNSSAALERYKLWSRTVRELRKSLARNERNMYGAFRGRCIRKIGSWKELRKTQKLIARVVRG